MKGLELFVLIASSVHKNIVHKKLISPAKKTKLIIHDESMEVQKQQGGERSRCPNHRIKAKGKYGKTLPQSKACTYVRSRNKW
jgi:hypothetical protein